MERTYNEKKKEKYIEKRSNGDVCAVDDNKEKKNELEMGQLEREGKGLSSKERQDRDVWRQLVTVVSNIDPRKSGETWS